MLCLLFAVYSVAVYRYSDPAPAAKISEPAAKGQALWREKNCQGCHQIYGLGGYLGPDLTNVISQKGSDYAATFIRYGSGRMPQFHLQEEEVRSLIAYLQWVDASGKSKVPAEAVNRWGSYTLK